MHSPWSEQFEMIYWIPKYLNGSLGKGLLFEKNNHLQVDVYTKADWTGNITDRRFTEHLLEVI